MSAPQFKFEWSFGNLVQIFLICLTGAGAYFKLQSDVTTIARDVARVTAEVSAEKTRRDAERNNTYAQIRALEQSSVRSDERLQSILTLLARIDDRLERIEQESRP